MAPICETAPGDAVGVDADIPTTIRRSGERGRMTITRGAERTMRISRVHFPVTALGPGRRVGIWAQGCSIGCVGCVSLDTWDPHGGNVASIDALAAIVDRAVQDGCSGLTISGGEPFDQARALGVLISRVRDVGAQRSVELDILCYSGYAVRRLRRVHPLTLAQLDGVISGPFVEALPTDLALRGSANQEFIALSELGRTRYDDLIDQRNPRPGFQVAVEDDTVTMIGIPRRDDLAQLTARARLRGVHLDAVSWSP